MTNLSRTVMFVSKYIIESNLHSINFHIALCAQPLTPEHGRFSSHIETKRNGECVEGVWALFECEPGYEANNQSICQEDGTWSPTNNCVGNNIALFGNNIALLYKPSNS